MLLNSVIIVLREVLEAAMILSVLLAASRMLGMSLRWAGIALLLGIFLAFLYGSQMAFVSDQFDGVGQELFNATLQLVAFGAILVCVFLIVKSAVDHHAGFFSLKVSMTVALALLVAREGAEIYVFLSGFVGTEDFLSSTGVGAIIGAFIGFSAGALLYYFLISTRARFAMHIALWLLALMGAGMCAQAIQLLVQADWISASHLLWDTSSWLAEDTITGQLLYAMIGYEATPSVEQGIVYLCSIGAVAVAIVLGYLSGQRESLKYT